MLQPLTNHRQSHCHGDVPLTGRIEPWMNQAVDDPNLRHWLSQYGSPLNIVNPLPMARNIEQLNRVASGRNVAFRIYFARKANKCLSFVQQAMRSSIGVDTASENEVRQCLEIGVGPADLICSAAVKSDSLLQLCVQHQICIALDNHDELLAVIEKSRDSEHTAHVAIRLGGFHHNGTKLPTRFGFDVDANGLLDDLATDSVTVRGVHFHLDGYDASQRVSAIEQSLRWIEALRAVGHPVEFLDIGGGFPMSYLDDAEPWRKFWEEHDRALLGDRTPITFRNHALGKFVHHGQVIGKPNVYPFYQQPVRDQWLADVLDSQTSTGTIADRIREAKVQLRCEPGRSLLDGCGMTVARVEFRKQNADGDCLIGLAMNRTQCRTTNDDFLVDPLLIPTSLDRPDAMTGYLVGAYCTESELISLRRLHFPTGVCRGDLVMFPNTAGYLMHFLESRSHQFPLAQNLDYLKGELDPIDHASNDLIETSRATSSWFVHG